MSEGSGVVITGLGVVSSIGVGKDAFCRALLRGESGIRPITVFNPALFKTKLGGEVVNFDAANFLPAKGLEDTNRCVKFIASAAKLALDDAGLAVNEENTGDIGVVTATTLSAIWNISELGREAAQDGPQFVSPGLFPGTTINAPSSRVAIYFGIKGFNTTVSTGFTAGIDALKYAFDFIKLGRAKVILVCGVEELSFQSFAGFHKVEFLAGIKGEEVCCPFDKRRNGIILGEGSAVLVLENEDYAGERNARIYARVKSVENSFDAFRSGKYQPEAEGLKLCARRALANAGLRKEDIDYVSSSANSVQLQDKLESAVIKEVFAEYAQKIPVSAVKSMLGEIFSASGLFQAVSVVCGMEQGFIPPTINYRDKDTDCGLDYVTEGARAAQVKNVLVNNFGPGGNNGAAVISKY